MSNVPFAIYTESGNELSAGLKPTEPVSARRLAQRFADERGEVVDLYQGSMLIESVRPLSEQAKALADASGIVDGTGALYTVCEQAIRDGEGTPERVRQIWAEATSEALADRS